MLHLCCQECALTDLHPLPAFRPLTFIFLHEGPHVSLLRAVGEGTVAHILAFPAVLCMDTQLLRDREQNVAFAQPLLARGESGFKKTDKGIKSHTGKVTEQDTSHMVNSRSFSSSPSCHER